MTAREKAITICREASKSAESAARHTAAIALALGYDVRKVADDKYGGDWEGPDMEAVELAATAWLRVDPEPLGIETPHDPRRDAAAADLLEKESDDESEGSEAGPPDQP
jgi:hypothetical protein